MKKVVVFLADGAEEIEALSPVDMLRRAGADVTLAGVGKKEIICAHNVKIVCDKELSEISGEDFDMYVLPGGGLGTENLSHSELVLDTVKKRIPTEKRLRRYAPLLRYSERREF